MNAAPQVETLANDPLALNRMLWRMRKAGFEIRAVGENLEVSPSGKLNDTQRAYLRAHKVALVALLTDAALLEALLTEAETAGLPETVPPGWDWERRFPALDVLIGSGRAKTVLGRDYLVRYAPVLDVGPTFQPPDRTARPPPALPTPAQMRDAR